VLVFLPLFGAQNYAQQGEVPLFGEKCGETCEVRRGVEAPKNVVGGLKGCGYLNDMIYICDVDISMEYQWVMENEYRSNIYSSWVCRRGIRLFIYCIFYWGNMMVNQWIWDPCSGQADYGVLLRSSLLMRSIDMLLPKSPFLSFSSAQIMVSPHVFSEVPYFYNTLTSAVDFSLSSCHPMDLSRLIIMFPQIDILGYSRRKYS
jgi:hypothetical protein